MLGVDSSTFCLLAIAGIQDDTNAGFAMKALTQ